MKKAIFAFIALVVIVIGGFMFLLNKASPDNAPQDVKIIELPDTYEK